MSRQLKSVVSLFLTAIMVFGAVPIGCYVGVDLPDFLTADCIVANAASLTQSEFDDKLASARSIYPEGTQKTNWPKGQTCHGYVRWLSEYVWGYDFSNGNGTGWSRKASTSSSTYISTLVPGDVIRYRSNTYVNHTIFITKVSSDIVYFTDCNSDGASTIKWNRSINRSTLEGYLKKELYNYSNETERYGYIAHYNPNSLTNEHVLKVYFNANGGSISSDTYKLSLGLIYNKSDSTKYYQKWTYNNTKENGLVNYSTFGIHRTGFKFVGWGTKPSGGTVFSQSDNTLKPSDINPNIVNGSCSITLYAQWESKGNYVDVWVSTKGKDYQYTECPEISQGIVQNKYYFWFKLANSESNELYNTYANSNYKSIISVYNPDGSLLYSAEYNKSDNNWIGATPTQIGKYKVNIKITGDVTANYSEYFTVKSDGKVTLTPSTLTLDLKSSPSKTVEIALSGNWPDGATYSIKTTNSNISQTNSGRTITVTAKKKGTSKLYVDILDKDGNVITSATTNVTVTAPEYNVTYNVNGGSGAPSSQVKIYGTALTLSSTKPTRKGYTFVNWNTKADGTGKSYAAGASYTSNAAVTLYAQWKANTYTVAFNGNGSTSGSMSNLSVTYGTAKNLTANAFAKTGYTFNGWNTKADGSGTSYANKASVKNLTSANGGTVTLYAQWKANTYTVAFNGNGSSSGSMSNLSVTYGTAKNLTANAYAKTGYTFNGWNTKADGSGTSYANKASVKNLTSANGGTVTLYAQWKANTYTVAFNGNGSSSGSMSNLSMTYDVAKNLTANAYAKTGYTFNGWNTKADGSGTSYTNKASVKNLTSTNGGTVTLYAIWQKNAVNSYTLTYNANGGSGAPSAQSGATSYTISTTKPTRSGYLFLGWSESKTATMASYTSGDSITLTSDTTLYAVWFRMPNLTTTEVVIRKPSIVALSYGDSLILHADLSKDLPVGWRIEWTADNANFKYTVSDDGTTCTITPENSGSTSFTATVCDAYGNEISEDTQVMKSKAGFFDKLIAFFKKLFGLTKVIQQSIDTIY